MAITIKDSTGASVSVATVVSGSDYVPLHKHLPANTSALTSVAYSTNDGLLLAANANRLGATVYNAADRILYLVLGNTTASTSTYSLQIAAGGFYEVPYSFTGQIRGIWASGGSGAAKITEITL
jgi:hypothetical protein